jgi:hypothetical protein
MMASPENQRSCKTILFVQANSEFHGAVYSTPTVLGHRYPDTPGEGGFGGEVVGHRPQRGDVYTDICTGVTGFP